MDSQRSILSGIPAESIVSGKQICACKQVGELTIIDAIKEGADALETILYAQVQVWVVVHVYPNLIKYWMKTVSA